MVELIAIVVIMALMLLIILPSINNTIKQSEGKKKETDLNNIYMAAENYLMANYEQFPLINDIGGIEYIYIIDLISNEYISIDTLNPNNNQHFTNKDAVMVSRNFDGSFDYQLVSVERLSEYLLKKHPYLELGENGCKSSSENNYSYMGGCYLKNNPDVNYIWFAGFFWKPMGFNSDGTLRIIAAEPITAIPWGGDDVANTWNNSYVNDWLNNYYFNNISDFYKDKIYEYKWCIEKTDDINSKRVTCNQSSTTKMKIGLITLDEYNLAGGINSYINGFGYVYTMTQSSEKNKVWRIQKNGYVNSSTIKYADSIVPVININGYDQVIYRIEENTIYSQISDKKGANLSEIGQSGEFVMFANKKYRIISKDKDNNIKLFLDGYYVENDKVYTTSYGNSNIYSTSITIGQKANNDVLNWLIDVNDSDNRNKIIYDYTWNINDFDIGLDYRSSIEENNPDYSVKSTIGLIRLGDILATQGLTQLTSNFLNKLDYSSAYNYWGITPYANYANYIFSADYSSGFGWPKISESRAIRPIIVVKSSVKILSGTGTWLEPYQI